MKKTIIICVFLIVSFNLFSQTAFDLLINTNEDEVLDNAIELPNGDIVLCGGIGNLIGFSVADNGYLLKLNRQGEVVLEKKINIPNNFFRFQNLHIKDANSFVAFAISGNKTGNFRNILLYNVYDFNFNLLSSKQLNLPINDISIIRIKSYKSSDNNFILIGTTQKEVVKIPDFEVFFYKVSYDGDSINSNFILDNEQTLGTGEGIIPKKHDLGYFALTHGLGSIGQVLSLDDNFEVILNRPIPRVLGNYGMIKWFNDTSYLITGWDYNNEEVVENFEHDIGIMHLDTVHNIINSKRYGEQQDTVDTAAPYNSIVYNEGDDYVYIAGTSNHDFFNNFYSSKKSYIYFVKTDMNLEPIFEKFYKGDAYYFVSYFTQLNDDGFLFLSTRYDHKVQTNERDIYILKVDAQGNPPVSIEEPKIKAQELIIYPNPSRANFNVRTAVQCIGGVFTMYNISGKQVFLQTITDRITQINTEKLPTGAYIYKYMHNGKEIENGKWIKNAL